MWIGSYPPYIQTIFFPFLNFLNLMHFFFIFVNMRPYGSENFKTLLLQQLQFFFNQPFSTYSLWQSPQKLLLGISKFRIWNFEKTIEIFHNMPGTLWDWKFQSATPTVWFLFRPKFFWMFPVTIHTKRSSLNFEILNLNLKKDWNLAHCAQWENAKLPIYWKWPAA